MNSPLTDDALLREAQRIHHDAIVIDGHNDVAGIMVRDDFDFGTDGTGRTDTDLARLQAGGVTGQFFAIFVPPGAIEQAAAPRHALDRIDAVYRAVEQYGDQMVLATTPADIQRAKSDGKIAALLGIEGGWAIDNSLSALRVFYRLGVRYVTLTWIDTHHWADASGSPYDTPNPALARHNGLSAFGKEVIGEMNRLGMMVDISHASDKTVLDALAVSHAPIIASHSSARSLSDLSRNLSDELVTKIATGGGIVMLNYASEFLHPKYLLAKREWQTEYDRETAALREQFPDTQSDDYRNGLRRLRATRTRLAAPLSLLVDHLDHLVKVAGIDHVGLGSDFDGGVVPPAGLDDVSRLPNLTLELLRRGYNEGSIRKILGENLLRVFGVVEAYGREHGGTISGHGSRVRWKK